MSVLRIILSVVVWIMALDWLWRSLQALRGMASVPDVTDMRDGSLPVLAQGSGPDITVIVPACDEQETIQSTLESLLRSEGVRLQIIAIDDRSADETGQRMETIAASAVGSSHTVEVIRNRELPPGWLGKPHALHLGAQRAQAQWLLFTDADVEFAPEAIVLALQMAIKENADHCVLVPTLTHRGIAVAAIQGTVQCLGQATARMWKIADPLAKDFFGVGGFNLVRTNALQAVGGIERLRMEVVEDVSIGWLVKHELGGRSMMVLGPGLVQIEWIQGIWGIVRLLEKNAFAGLRYLVGMAALVCFGLGMQAFVPLLALGAGWWGIAACIALHIGVGINIYANRKLSGVSPWLAVLYTPSVAIVGWAFFRSTVLTLWRGGVVWRGRLYPLAELRRHKVPWRLR